MNVIPFHVSGFFRSLTANQEYLKHCPGWLILFLKCSAKFFEFVLAIISFSFGFALRVFWNSRYRIARHYIPAHTKLINTVKPGTNSICHGLFALFNSFAVEDRYDLSPC